VVRLEPSRLLSGAVMVSSMLRRRKGGPKGGDFFKRSVDERRASEDETPWFLADDDGPELQVETGIGSNLTEDDLDA
jgi:hypothetical protein